MTFRLYWRSVKWDSYNVDSLVSFAQYLWESEQRDHALGIQRLAVCVGDKKEYAADTYFQMLQATGQAEEGLKFLQKRVESYIKQSADPVITLVNILDRLNRPSEARELLERASQERPEDAALQIRFARFEALSGHPERCNQLLDEAFEQTNPYRGFVRLANWSSCAEHSSRHWLIIKRSSNYLRWIMRLTRESRGCLPARKARVQARTMCES